MKTPTRTDRSTPVRWQTPLCLNNEIGIVFHEPEIASRFTVAFLGPLPIDSLL